MWSVPTGLPRLGPDAVIVSLAADTGFKYMTVRPYK